MRPSGWLLASLAVTALGACSSDLFHSTSWPSGCDMDASALACGGAGGVSLSASVSTTSSATTASSTHASSTSTGAGGSGAGGASASASSSSSGAGGASMFCVNYCTQVMQTCVGGNAVYPDEPTCLATCAVLPPGTKGDTTGDTIECRLTALANMVPVLAKRCARAGPGSFNPCGGPGCDAYCILMSSACKNTYADLAACQSACAGFVSNGVEYSIGDKMQNTLQCRLYYASLATVDPSACSSALPTSLVCM